MSRLSVIDEIFLLRHRGFGTPIALQGLWRSADRIDPEQLRRIHDALRRGPLGRRVVRPRVPGARPYWQPTVAAHPLLTAPGPVPAAALLDWADGLGDGLDPEHGPGWRLAVAEVDDGGSMVSLTCSHALADGRGLALAVDQALSGTPVAELAAPQSDWADAWRQWSIVLGGTARALRHGLPARPDPVRPRRAEGSAAYGAVLSFSVADWELAATGRAGTTTSLFVYLIARMLWDSGFAEPTIVASLPVDTRFEPRVNNDLITTEVVVTRADTPATLREKCRAAYDRRMSAPGGLPEELLQVVPGRLAHLLSAGAGERDILCSNLGALPISLTRLGPHLCTGVAARAIHPGLRTDRLPRTRLSGYLSRIAGTYTLALTSLDPTAIPSPTALTDLATSALHHLDLTPTAW